MHNLKHQFVLQVFLRRKLRRGGLDSTQAKAVREVLADDDLSSAVALETQELFGRETGSIMEFLEWLLANADTIIALIVKIIDLFSQQEPVNA